MGPKKQRQLPRFVSSYKSMPAEPAAELWLPGHPPIKGWQDENAEIIKCYHHDGERDVQIVKVH